VRHGVGTYCGEIERMQAGLIVTALCCFVQGGACTVRIGSILCVTTSTSVRTVSCTANDLCNERMLQPTFEVCVFCVVISTSSSWGDLLAASWLHYATLVEAVSARPC